MRFENGVLRKAGRNQYKEGFCDIFGRTFLHFTNKRPEVGDLVKSMSQKSLGETEYLLEEMQKAFDKNSEKTEAALKTLSKKVNLTPNHEFEIWGIKQNTR